MYAFYGCNIRNSQTSSEIETINIHPMEADEFIPLSEIADSIKCIKLQIDSGDAMGRIREIIIKKKYIYAVDISQQVIFVFNKEGLLVTKLNKKGRGPGEYSRIGPVFIDDDESYIEIVNYTGGKQSILRYKNLSFDYINTTLSYPDISANSVKRHKGLFYFAIQQIDNHINDKDTNGDLVICDSENNFKVLFDKKIITERHYFSMTNECFSINNKEELFFSPMYGNRFYQLKDWEAIPLFQIDFGTYNMSEFVGLQSTREQMEYIRNMNHVASFPVLNIYDDRIFAFSYYFKESDTERWIKESDFRQYVKFKKSKKVYHAKMIKNDLSVFPDRLYISSYFFGCVHQVLHEDYLVDIILPDLYFNDMDEKVYVEGLGEISADSDPIIVMAKLKNDL
ncbi:hypothetical protein Tanf_11140 [Tannerella forsythia]|nr:6-bladed beta-propeller [Tannerella forsythia]KKY60765.1 hypothetical protein Tanf_11140 [Tannerella forsythia]OLQ19933.1 hypothetical protein BGK60_02410 [Tannerella forsythia]